MIQDTKVRCGVEASIRVRKLCKLMNTSCPSTFRPEPFNSDMNLEDESRVTLIEDILPS